MLEYICTNIVIRWSKRSIEIQNLIVLKGYDVLHISQNNMVHMEGWGEARSYFKQLEQKNIQQVVTITHIGFLV